MQGPFIPGTRLRFRVPRDTRDQSRIRQEVQDGGHGLYIFELPFNVAGTFPKCLVEAYYPWELSDAMRNQLDPMRRADAKDGSLVALTTVPVAGTFKVGQGKGSVHAFFRLTAPMLEEIRRNNRNARSDLKRQSSAHARKLALNDAREAKEAKAFKEWEDFYVDAWRESVEYGLGKPRVSMHGAY